MSKVLSSLEEAIRASGLKDGMTISFHHHLRGGDYILKMVLEKIAEMKIGNLTVNASSVHDGHGPLVPHLRSRVVTNVETNYMSPVVGRDVSNGIMENPVLFRTHGARAGDIDCGESHIDVAFIGAPTSDPYGNCTGTIGKSACGSLGYAFADVEKADKVIIITDNLVPYPLKNFSISEVYVDYVVQVDSIGDPQNIASGTARMTRDPVALRIADLTAKVISASGLLKDGFSFQTGAGGVSLAVGETVQKIMLEKKIRGSFALGGITGYIVGMLEKGCFETIMDVQCFDLSAVESLRNNPNHVEISASHYSSPRAKNTVAEKLDAVVLGATQIDTNFNVNVHTDSNGYIIGGSGGHSDVAACSKLALVVAPLSRARLSIVVDKVLTLTTPGKTIDVLVTQCGIAVNPARVDLKKDLQKAGLPVVAIEDLQKMAEKANGVPDRQKFGEKLVGKVQYRDGTIIDEIWQVLPPANE